MAAKEPRNQRKSEGEQQKGQTELRDQLVSKVKGEDEGPRGAAGPTREPAAQALNRPISIGGPSNLDRAGFCRQLATLIGVGVPILKSLQLIEPRTSNARLRSALQQTIEGLESGQTVHQAMSANMRVFSPLVVNIVRIGEMGGILEPSLQRLADIMEKKVQLRRRVVSAMMYPAAALIVAIAVLMIIMVKAMPVFVEVYGESREDLPGPTQAVISISEFLQATWWIIIIGLVLVVILLKLWARTSSGNAFFSWLGLTLPGFRGMSQKIAAARASRTLGGLVTAGIPLADALAITAETNENYMVSKVLHQVHERVSSGERMADPLMNARIFPVLLPDMIAIGEETGTLDTMLNKVADIYDQEVDAAVSGLSSIIEPILIVVLGGIVVFIALAVLLPYFNLASGVV